MLSEKINITCPKCRRKLQQPLGRLTRHHKFACVCGAQFTVENDQFGQAARALDSFRKSLTRFGRR